jgi:hypothetical protein
MIDNNVIKPAQPGTFIDSLTEILRGGARALLTQAVEAEVADFLHRHCDLKTDAGRRCVVRHGHLPEREIMTGIGPVGVRQPRIRDREADAGVRSAIQGGGKRRGGTRTVTGSWTVVLSRIRLRWRTDYEFAP